VISSVQPTRSPSRSRSKYVTEMYISRQAGTIEVYAFPTTTPNKLVAMSVLLTRGEEFEAWLSGSIRADADRAGGV
jgi:hypothetical protein